MGRYIAGGNRYSMGVLLFTRLQQLAVATSDAQFHAKSRQEPQDVFI